MRTDHIHDLGKVLFLDIETVPVVASWSELDERTARRIEQLFARAGAAKGQP